IGGKFYVLAQVEVVDGFHQADAADLKEIVHVFAAVVEPLDDAEDEAQVALNELGAGVLIAVPHSLQQFSHVRIGQHRQLGRVDAANLHLVHSSGAPSCVRAAAFSIAGSTL